MGPLAGPVVAAAVVLPARHGIQGLADSKKLSERQREVVAAQIRERAHAFALGRAEVSEVDTLNVLQASWLAMRRALEGLGMIVDLALVDGLHVPPLPCPARAIVRGDARVPAISAASVLAKTVRDAEMRVWDARYPAYGFGRHKGYGTALHLAALRRHGPCPLHRKSFAPVRAATACGKGET